MKKFVIVMVMLCAGSAFAGAIYDVQTGVYALDAEVTIEDAVVTGVRYNGVFVNEQVNGPYTGVWVYTGVAPGVLVGDLVDVKGLYKEYFDLTEIDVAADLTGYLTFDSIHTGALVAVDMTIPALQADPEPWESCFIQITSGMMVTEILTYGEWKVEDVDAPGQYLVMDDYWYDETTVLVGDCYSCAVGILMYNYGVFKLEPFEGNICVVDCSVGNEEMTFGGVKALYR
jgi:hypothetical protein